MAITQSIATQFLKQLLTAQHDFSAAGGHTFKMALYSSSATLDTTTTDYTTTGEVSGTGYSAGGNALTNIEPAQSGTTAYIDFSDLTFSTVTITARGAMIYNTTTGGGAGTTDCCLNLDFGSDKVATAQDFTVNFPTADATNAIFRLA